MKEELEQNFSKGLQMTRAGPDTPVGGTHPAPRLSVPRHASPRHAATTDGRQDKCCANNGEKRCSLVYVRGVRGGGVTISKAASVFIRAWMR